MSSGGRRRRHFQQRNGWIEQEEEECHTNRDQRRPAPYNKSFHGSGWMLCPCGRLRRYSPAIASQGRRPWFSYRFSIDNNGSLFCVVHGVRNNMAWKERKELYFLLKTIDWQPCMISNVATVDQHPAAFENRERRGCRRHHHLSPWRAGNRRGSLHLSITLIVRGGRTWYMLWLWYTVRKRYVNQIFALKMYNWTWSTMSTSIKSIPLPASWPASCGQPWRGRHAMGGGTRWRKGMVIFSRCSGLHLHFIIAIVLWYCVMTLFTPVHCIGDVFPLTLLILCMCVMTSPIVEWYCCYCYLFVIVVTLLLLYYYWWYCCYCPLLPVLLLLLFTLPVIWPYYYCYWAFTGKGGAFYYCDDGSLLLELLVLCMTLTYQYLLWHCYCYYCIIDVIVASILSSIVSPFRRTASSSWAGRGRGRGRRWWWRWRTYDGSVTW